MNNITKCFNNSIALSNVSIALYEGEVCSIIGENGAGKSTLMNILAGNIEPDIGEIIFRNKVVPSNLLLSRSLGIKMCYQEPNLVENFTIAQNIFLGSEPTTRFMKTIDREKMLLDSRKILNDMGFGHIDVNRRVKNISYADRKIIEIARALKDEIQILILDEPTAAMSSIEIRILFKLIIDLKSKGISTIFVSHKIEEVKEISDRIYIIRDGVLIDEKLHSPTYKIEELIEKMAGKDYKNRYPKVYSKKGDVLFEALKVTNESHTIHDVSFSIRKGEIVGVSGLQGSGKSSLGRIAAGIERICDGNILLNGKSVHFREPYSAVKKGIVYLSSDLKDNVFFNKDVYFNITISNLRSVSNCFVKNGKEIKRVTASFVQILNMKISRNTNHVKYLSQGTIQKVALAKWFFANANLFIINEPTKSLDIPSKVEIYNLMNKIVRNGGSILLISSDLREILGMSDRIIVMHNGGIIGELESKEANSVKILQYASGILN